MDPPTRLRGGFRLHSRQDRAPHSPFVTSPPTLPKRDSSTMSTREGRLKENVPFTRLETIRPDDVLGQLSYAPATQTTVVTTTTTTTTEFPPFMMKGPQHLHDLDPKQYPLASTPTPQCIKRLRFDVDGRPTMFQEAEDTLETLEKLKYQQRALSESDGALRSVAGTKPEYETPTLDPKASGGSRSIKRQQTPIEAPYGSRKRPVSPVVTSDAAVQAGALARPQGARKRRMVSTGKASPGFANSEPSTHKTSHSRLNLVQTSTPVTPYLEPVRDRRTPAWAIQTHQERELDNPISSQTSSTFEADNEDDNQILSPESEVNRSMAVGELDDANTDVVPESEIRTPWRELGSVSAITPHKEIDGDEVFPHISQSERPRPMVVNTTAAQDVSLPSPSLSPVTAAANMHSRREYFELPQSTNSQHALEYDSAHQSFQSLAPTSQSGISIMGYGESRQDTRSTNATDLASMSYDGEISARSLMSIPSMIETFGAMPEEMKSYCVYQFLRRCSKPVLHFIADVVNPALKCDFLRLLPVELCLNIIGNLDAKTLCRAAQVSRRWRQLVDSSEKVWKRLFDADNYTLPEGELPRAIREGWGWQYTSHLCESEKDLSTLAGTSSNIDLPTRGLLDSSTTGTYPASNGGSTTNSQPKRSKRKPKSRSKPTHRKLRTLKVQEPSTSLVDIDDEPFLDMASADGPYAAANAAERAVPYPEIGLSSLKNLHLFKSIYMRHHLIRKTWMTDEVSPRHIAFRAHQGHVVTCLQFDADKILTGSDDANINVYDTKTGAQRSTLEGHEGGVWALQYQGNVLVSGSTDRTVRVWDIEKGRCTQIFQGHTSTVRCLQILMPTRIGTTFDDRPVLMPKQPLIITGSRDSNLRVWKLPKPGDPDFFQAGPAPDESAECPYYVRTLAGHHHSVRAIAAHADTLVSGSYDCSVRVWKISTGETVHRLNGHSQKVYSVVLDTKRNRCISGSMDNLVKVWSLDSGSVLFNLEGHSSLVGLLDLQQDRLVSAAADSTLRIWDPENGHCKSTLTAHTGAITCFQHDGQKVISGSDRTLKMWNVVNGEFSKDLLTDLSGVWQVKFNDRRCVAAVQRNSLTYIEVLDFGASRDGIPKHKRGKRIVVNAEGKEVSDPNDSSAEVDITVED